MIPRHFLDLQGCSTEQLNRILSLAQYLRSASTWERLLSGRVVGNLCFWAPGAIAPGRRVITEMQWFEAAEQRLGAVSINAQPGPDESLVNATQSVVTACGPIDDVSAIVVSHFAAGAPHRFAHRDTTGVSVVNLCDGPHEDPCAALTIIAGIRSIKEAVAGQRVCILGDLRNSAVCRSLVVGLMKLGAEVELIGLPSFFPTGSDQLGAQIRTHPEAHLPARDVLITIPISIKTLNESGIFSAESYLKHVRRELESASAYMHADTLAICCEPETDDAVDVCPELPPSIMSAAVRERDFHHLGIAIRGAVLVDIMHN